MKPGASNRGRNDAIGSAGFTLVEMLVVLAILAMLATIIFPRVQSSDGRRIRTIAGEIAVDFRSIRDESLRRGAITSFVITESGYKLLPSGRSRAVPKDAQCRFIGRLM